jgi:choline dehydrogenase-like flavoprotein
LKSDVTNNLHHPKFCWNIASRGKNRREDFKDLSRQLIGLIRLVALLRVTFQITMEGDGGCAIANIRVRDGKRLSIFRSCTYPVMDQPNLTVVTNALVTKITIVQNRAIGVEILIGRNVQRIEAVAPIFIGVGDARFK